MRIHRLNPLLANQIAAGEVIERPASVVKELVENALDAGATQISIEIEQGGQDLIRVRDNGGGIHPEDLALSLERHATSKIATFDDLVRVQSLGFRGEALASIAAVSRLKMASKKAEQNSGFFVQSEGGHIIEKCAPIAHPLGTTLEIRELFFNTPARKKFLRKASTEFSHIQEMISRLALAQFSVAFTLKHNDQVVFQSQAASTDSQQSRRIADVMGQDFLSRSLRIEMEAAGLHIRGWIGLPTYSRTQSDLQYFYINKRFVRDKLLMHAVRSAYQDVLFNGRHPAYALFITIDPTAVDVNVHPTKHEVRFRDQRMIHDAVRHAIQDAISQLSPQEIIEKSPELMQEKRMSFGAYRQRDAISSAVFPQKVEEHRLAYEALSKLEPENQAEKMREILHPLGYALGQIHHTFIVAQNAQGMVLVDMHAAHERILYEKLKSDLAAEGISRQALLIPITVDLNRQDMRHWEEAQETLAEIGLITEAVGPETIMIREIPTVLKKLDLGQLVRDLLSDMNADGKSLRLRNTLDELLGNMACKAALKANHPLGLESLNALLRQMEVTPKSGCCNHGRPTWVQLSTSDLDKFFMRGQ